MQTLNPLHHQMQPTGIHNVAGDLRRVHPLLAGVDFQFDRLYVGDGLKGFLQQVRAVLHIVFAQALSEVIQDSDLKSLP